MSFKLVLLLLLTIECFVGGGYLFLKKGRSALSVKVLSGFILILGLVFFETFIVNLIGRESSNPLVVLFSYMFFVLCLLLPPTCYLYVLSLIKKKEEVLAQHNLQLYFLPAVFLFAINIFSFFALYTLEPGSNNYNMLSVILTYCNFISLFFIFLVQNVYFIYNSWLFYFDQKAIVNEAKVTDSTLTVRWLFAFIMLYTIIIIMLYVFQLSPLFPGKVIFRIFTLLYVGLLIYFGNNNYQFIKENNTIRNLNTDKIDDLKSKLTAIIDEEAIYLDNDLSLAKLAHAIGTNSKYLSYLINKEFDTNFSSFVNRYRIEHAKKLLSDPSNDIYTIKTIAEMTGFKSKSSFNTAFKKVTDTTPSVFKNSVA